MRRGILRFALAAVAVLGLAGCVGGEPLPTLPPTPTATPLFASEEEALAAAEDAYEAYLEMSNLISSEGGADPERIATVAVDEIYASSLEGFETLRQNEWRSDGESVLASIDLQFADLDANSGEDIVAAYVCVDYSRVDVLDRDGASVVSPERPDVQAFEVFFDATAVGSLVAASREPWDAAATCATA